MEPDLEFYDGPLPLFPLPRFSLLPFTIMPLHIFEPRYRRMVRDTLEDRKMIGMVHIEGEAWPANPSIRPIGCAGRIGEVTPLPEGRMLLALHGLRKFRVLKERRRGAYRTARVEWIEDLNENACGPAADAAVRRIIERLDLAARAREEEPAGTRLDDRSLPFVGRVNQLALSTRLDRDEFVGVLELRDVYARARRLVRLLDSRADARSRAARFRPFLTDDPARN